MYREADGIYSWFFWSEEHEVKIPSLSAGPHSKLHFFSISISHCCHLKHILLFPMLLYISFSLGFIFIYIFHPLIIYSIIAPISLHLVNICLVNSSSVSREHYANTSKVCYLNKRQALKSSYDFHSNSPVVVPPLCFHHTWCLKTSSTTFLFSHNLSVLLLFLFL